MEGVTNWNDSFPETSDSSQGSPNSYVDRLASLGDRLDSVESRLSNHMLAHDDGSIGRTSTPCSRAQINRGWDHGESSSTGNNMQEQTLDDDSKMKFAWYSSSAASSVADIRPEDGPPESSTTISPSYVGNQVTDTSHPLIFRSNHQHLRENSNCPSGLGGGQPHLPYESGSVGTEEIPVRYASSSNLGTSSLSSSPSIEINDASGPSLGAWGSSCKRKALEGTSRPFHQGGSSNSDQPMENIVQHPNLTTSVSASSSDRLEQLNSSSGVGTDRVRSGHFTSSSVQGIAQNPIRDRNFASRSSPRHQEPIPFYPSRGPSVGYRACGEANLRSSVPNILEYPTIGPASDGINFFGDQIDWSFTPGTSASFRNYSGGRSSSTAWLPHGNQTSQDPRRSLESVHWIPYPSFHWIPYPSFQWIPYPSFHWIPFPSFHWIPFPSFYWIPFPSFESIPGNQRSPVAPLRRASASSGERASLSHAQHQLDRSQSSFLRDARGDNTNGRNVLAAVGGRHRMNLLTFSFQYYMPIYPFVNGFAELHDQNIDARLDVDNMSYEDLLALQEQIGIVSTGLSEERMQASLKERKHGAVKASEAMEPCCICREDYVAGDDIGILNCKHEFHTSCIKQWLIRKNICPICKSMALGT